ncbi:MAG: aspartate kinase [Flavobacteriaceae bacterium]|nr:aspartate kinase [Flavobacteriaceae bacterium]
MIVMKFGGTSVGSSESIEKVLDIISSESRNKIIVLSAFSGVTNLLVEINNQYEKGGENIPLLLVQLQEKCLLVVNPLFKTAAFLLVAQNFIALKINEIRSLLQLPFNEESTRKIIAQGEFISTNIFQFFLQDNKFQSSLISALDFMSLNKNNEPTVPLISKKIISCMKETPSHTYITQGFICMNYDKQISNLERGGSDYTASLIGAAIDAEEIQIWTDIDGMHNNDPRYVDNTFSLEEISFDEAAELAYFGAKILHPQSLYPAKEKNIPVRLKNTFHPEKKGTIIKNFTVNKGVASIAAKDGITAIKIKSYRMLLAYGFLKQVFEVFETYQTPIDMITTSEVAVSLTIDNNKYLSEIKNSLQEFGTVDVDTGLSIVCVAGNFSQNKEGISTRVFDALKHIPIRMISYGGSNYNISLLVKTSHKSAALNALNDHLFKTKKEVLV